MSSNFTECRYYTNFKCPYFRTAGVYDHVVWHAGSPICIGHTDMTLTWSKVKVKVTEFLKFWKLHSVTSTSSAILAWHSQLMGDYDSMGLVYSFSEPDFWISPPLGSHVTSKFAKCWYHQNSLHFISALAKARSLWLWLQVGHNKPCMLAAMTVSPLVGLFYLKLWVWFQESLYVIVWKFMAIGDDTAYGYYVCVCMCVFKI